MTTAHHPTRRQVLTSLAALAGAGGLAACGGDGGESSGAAPDADALDGGGDATVAYDAPTYQWDGAPGPEGIFTHGVASGDPLADRVILWTRVDPQAAGAATSAELFWEMATDAAFASRVRAGTGSAAAARDWTCKVDADGLQPGTTYYYRFWWQGRASVVGRTRTLPQGKTDRLRFVFCSCSNFNGYFTAYDRIAARADLDAVLHLGDYIYEYAGNPKSARYAPPDHICVSLDDYRQRYGAHRLDPNLQQAHRQHPFICVWDDHESANNAWMEGAPAHDEAKMGPWTARRQAAWQAWSEWLPARVPEEGKIWRRFDVGDLATIHMLDTRLWGRAQQTTGGDKAGLADPERTFLGPDQEQWLHDGLAQSKARWQFLGQQVMIAPLEVGGTVLNSDQWDGYQATRDRLFARVRALGLGGFVVLTGDIHTSWANDLVEDSHDPAQYDVTTGKGALGVEFVVPGITSGGLPGGSGADLGTLAKEYNPHIRWNEVTKRGYGLVDVTRDRVQCDWWLLDGVDKPGLPESLAASWASDHGSGHLAKADAATVPPSKPPEPAP